MRRAAFLLCLLPSATSCYEEEPTRSSDIATADIQAYVQLDGDKESTRLSIELLGPGSGVDLVGGDALLAGVRGATASPLAVVDGKATAVLPPGISGVTFELRRPTPYESAAFTVDALPLDELVVPPVVSRAETLRIEWEPGNGSYYSSINVGGPCFTQIQRTSKVDPGFFTVQPEELTPSSETCIVSITLVRAADVNVPSRELLRADARLTQTMTATFESRP